MLLTLQGSVKPYAWGSRTAMAGLFGWPLTDVPMAELWLGTHPGGPATVQVDGRALPLDVLLAEQPHLSGDRGGLPFLLKVLAAERALSLQVHPDAEQASAGFDAEERAGVPLDAPTRRYRDRSAKCELVVALGDFRALAGVRDPAETLRVVRELGCAPVTEAFAPLADDPGADGVREVLRGLLSGPAARGAALHRALVAAARAATGSPDPAVARSADLVGVLAEHHPDDVGVVAALLLHDVALSAGQALYLPARVLHAYVSGMAVELMCCSDNVLRGGLTSKHVDVDELLAVLDPTPAEPVRADLGDGPSAAWEPGGGFVIHRLSPAGTALVPAVDGPAVMIGIEGALQVTADGSTRVLAAGQAVLVPAPGAVEVSGTGTGYLAACA